MKLDHNNIFLIESWLDRNKLTPALEDNFVRTTYHEVLEHRFAVNNTTKKKQRIRCYKLQYDFVRRDLLKIIYKRNNYSATGISAGYVYAISNPAWPGYLKIGCAIDVNDRLNTYQTSSPFRDYKLEDYYFVYDRKTEEARLHSQFPDRKLEWVQLDISVMKTIFKSRKEERAIMPTIEIMEASKPNFYIENNNRIFVQK